MDCRHDSAYSVSPSHFVHAVYISRADCPTGIMDWDDYHAGLDAPTSSVSRGFCHIHAHNPNRGMATCRSSSATNQLCIGCIGFMAGPLEQKEVVYSFCPWSDIHAMTCRLSQKRSVLIHKLMRSCDLIQPQNADRRVAKPCCKTFCRESTARTGFATIYPVKKKLKKISVCSWVRNETFGGAFTTGSRLPP